MWQAGTAAILVGSLWLLLRQLGPMRHDRLTCLAFGLIWTRFALAALGPTAVQTEVAGQSLIAFATLLAVFAVAAATPLSVYRSDRAVPIYVIAALGVVGTVLSGAVGSLPGYVTIWVLFAALALLLNRAYALHGPGPVLRALLAVFALPLAMQLLSLAAGMPKFGPDGSASYIGGYGHESVFAIVALGGLWVAAILPWRDRRLAWLAVAVGVAALVLANYRTMLIAALPLLLAFALSGDRGLAARRLPGVLAVSAAGLILLPAMLPAGVFGGVTARFAELGTLAVEWDRFLKPPETFTAADKNVLSARVYIWSSYAAAVGEARLAPLLLGHGAETLAPRMSVHPHNEYLRVAFQHGLLGAAALFGFVIALAVAASRAAPRRAGVMTAAGFASLLLAAAGTSIFDRPEGMIVLAILTATAWNLTASRAPRPRAA
ncbi:O-antigen ligase family protein [Histidinibacterium lentulum]|uniref:O-antigen ligase domain-containing protein n=1 Tax=Histidinibacterium lentulum TaxID=2480588 RepID=A0A3N2QS04_9RHOB|nr:O-antigen ligase family protein [Histidinibacterium lentulum]ROT97997.1 hypothetical protein EAT49_17125 [Histidinibacterium lentulum]